MLTKVLLLGLLLANATTALCQFDTSLVHLLKPDAEAERKAKAEQLLALGKSTNSPAHLYYGHFLKGRAFAWQYDWDSSLFHFEAAGRMASQLQDSYLCIKALVHKGDIKFKTGNTEDAKAMFLQVLRSRFSDSTDRSNAASLHVGCLRQQGRFGEAMSSLEEYGHFFHRRSLLYFNKGAIYAQTDRFDSALKYFRLSDREEPNTPSTISALGNIYSELEEYDSALYFYKKAEGLALQDSNFNQLASIYNNICDLYNILEDYDSATEYILKARENALKAQNFGMLVTVTESFEAALHNKALVARENYRLRTQQRNVVLVASGLLLLLSFVVFYLNRQRLRSRMLTAQALQALEIEQLNTMLSGHETASLQAMMEGRAVERKRIAEDLHDRLGSLMAALKLNFNVLSAKLSSADPALKNLSEKASELADRACEEVRKVSHEMARSEEKSFGLKQALAELLDTLNLTRSVKIELTGHGKLDTLPYPLALAVYRSCQELIANIVRHSKATEGGIHLTMAGKSLTVLVEDNGQGFDVEGKKQGIGLRNVRRRIQEIAGEVEWDSTPGHGTTVVINIDLDKYEYRTGTGSYQGADSR